MKTNPENAGASPWALAWVTAIEDACESGRLQRGMGYAEEGVVESIDVGPSLIVASVRGSRRDPYSVYIHVPLLEESERYWNGIDVGPLLAIAAAEGDPALMELAIDAGIPVVPGWNRVAEFCSCPDEYMPCKHVVAVWLVIGLAIDADPELLLFLRGIPKWSDLLEGASQGETAAARSLVSALAGAASSFVRLREKKRSSGRKAEDPGRDQEAMQPLRATVEPRDEIQVPLDPVRFWEGEVAAERPPRGMIDEPGQEPPWVFQPPEPFPLRPDEPSYVEVMHQMYLEIRAGAARWLVPAVASEEEDSAQTS